MDENITVTASDGGNTGKYYTNGEDWRFYQKSSSTLTISANDATISTVIITYTIEDKGVLTLNGTNIESDEVVSVNVNVNTITFLIGNTGSDDDGKVKITNIEVVYSETE